MLDLNDIRREMAVCLVEGPVPGSLDVALDHVLTLAHGRGLHDAGGCKTLPDLQAYRCAFIQHLAKDPTRFRLDIALAHATSLAYQGGINDANRENLEIPTFLRRAHGRA